MMMMLSLSSLSSLSFFLLLSRSKKNERPSTPSVLALSFPLLSSLFSRLLSPSR